MVLAWEVWQIVVLYRVYKHSIPTILLETNTSNSNTLLNITGLKTSNSRRQPVCYLEAWPWFWNEDNQEQIWKPEQDTNPGMPDWKWWLVHVSSSKWCDLGTKRFLISPIFIFHIAKGRCFNAATTVGILVFLHFMEQEVITLDYACR